MRMRSHCVSMGCLRVLGENESVGRAASEIFIGGRVKEQRLPVGNGEIESGCCVFPRPRRRNMSVTATSATERDRLESLLEYGARFLVGPFLPAVEHCDPPVFERLLH